MRAQVSWTSLRGADSFLRGRHARVHLLLVRAVDLAAGGEGGSCGAGVDAELVAVHDHVEILEGGANRAPGLVGRLPVVPRDRIDGDGLPGIAPPSVAAGRRAETQEQERQQGVAQDSLLTFFVRWVKGRNGPLL